MSLPRIRRLAIAAVLVLIVSAVASPSPARADSECPPPTVTVATPGQLAAALAAAQPGDVISVEDGTYDGNWTATTPGTAEEPIWLCGSSAAVLTNDGITGGYGLHLDGADWWHLYGFTVADAQKGVIVDAAEQVTVEGLTVHGVGDEGIHLRTHTVDSLVTGNTIHDTGNRREKFGEGVYIGSSDANWGVLTGGQPDRSDRNTIVGNTIYDTTAEAIDIKEGTSDGVVSGNVMDGAGQTEEGADSWVDAKGNSWTIVGNTGTHSLLNGYETHHRNLTKNGLGNWGLNNVFTGNVADVQGPGRGFYVHDPSTTGNVVHCDNTVTGAALGYANLTCAP
ncbi:right-handed parallel beta-helix repeat-containing protein [Streptosporangium sp. NBC_01755]|uniref:right-handed parallel beta-helix repeat-containing protein n=1 Tax=Streptosporangium sp. NBC_01755 TaxID=2975949 RepID=UPI002DD84732|nr:right-handed parallel beta-helix repeat-containing protein [Streptosporangium sp. NBC_01755]WSD01452.1 right-handed parallel beta-helix repeat-containing protein [Streptosporangium sp. NBC_01755]